MIISKHSVPVAGVAPDILALVSRKVEVEAVRAGDGLADAGEALPASSIRPAGLADVAPRTAVVELAM